MNIPEGYVLVPTEPTRIQLVAGLGTNGIHPIYCAMVSAAPPVELAAYDEAKERELFESEFKKPDTAKFDGEEYRYIGQAGRPDMVLFLEFVGGWYGWKKCAKSRARSAE